MTDVIDWPKPAPVRDILTEAGAAERFARQNFDALRYDHARGVWLRWDAHRWAVDDDGVVLRMAVDFVRAWQHDAIELPDRERSGAIIKFARRLEWRAGLRNMLDLARNFEPLADNGKSWDADPWLLGVRNGVVDLRTGTLRPGCRDDRITRQTRVHYDPDAPCPRWRQFLMDVFADDQDVIRFVQKAVGYSLTGDTSEQVFFLGHGTGANGKTTLLTTIAHVLGDYAWTMPFSTIELHQRQAIPNDLAALAGRRFVVTSETNDGTRLNESRMKALTGGDRIAARFLHAEFFEFTPVAKFWLAVNHKPIVRDDSRGFWRRVRAVPFTRTFPVNATLADALLTEGPGILAWAVRGTRAWQIDRLPAPPAIVDATDDYKRESDPLSEFLDVACDCTNAESEIRAHDLYEHYRWYADRVRLGDRERLTATAFFLKVGERHPKRRTNRGSVYIGVARKPLDDVFGDD